MRYLLLSLAMLCAGLSVVYTVHTLGMLFRGAGFEFLAIVMRLLMIVVPAVFAYWLLTDVVGML